MPVQAGKSLDSTVNFRIESCLFGASLRCQPDILLRGASMAVRINSFRDIASRYDVVLCDVWGVLHNGVAASSRKPAMC